MIWIFASYIMIFEFPRFCGEFCIETACNKDMNCFLLPGSCIKNYANILMLFSLKIFFNIDFDKFYYKCLLSKLY